MRNREVVIRFQLPESPHNRWLVAVCAAAGVSAGALAWAAVTYPASFMTGQPISSSAVNGYINDLNSRVANLETGARALAVVLSSNGTVTQQTGSWVTSAIHNNTGDYTINIASGAFSAAPVCTATIQAANSALNGGMTKIATDTGPSTGAVRVTTANTSGSLIDIAVGIVCVGPR